MVYEWSPSKGQVDAAVAWWSVAVSSPKFSALTKEERQDPRERPMVFAEGLAQCLVKPIADSALRTFESALASRIYDLARERGRVFLSVDYHPDPILAGAAADAGIPEGNFPWKTWMRFLPDGSVSVKYGYGAPDVTIYSESRHAEGNS